jgi:hypothetical protein
MLATSQPPPAKVVLITPFDSMVRVASEKFFFLPVWLLLLDRWDNIESLHWLLKGLGQHEVDCRLRQR